MSLVFETIQTEGLAEISYLIGDDEEGIAAVFDPRADVEVYLELARAKNVAITHIFETHIHADLVSGARELRGRLESAKIYVSHEGGADRKSTRLNSSHPSISYAVFCLKKKKKT